MAIIQVSEKKIKNNYKTLDEHIGKLLLHGESDLYYVNGLVYKIYKKIFRLYRQSYMWILDQNNFKNAINIENLLYQGDQLIGCSMQYYNNLQTLSEKLKTTQLHLYEANQIYQILLSFQKEILQQNLCYLDTTLDNITLYQDKPLITDIDGVAYKPDKSLIEASFKNAYQLYISIILKDNLFQYEINMQRIILKNLFGDKISLEKLSQIEADCIQEKYYKLKKDSLHYQSK